MIADFYKDNGHLPTQRTPPSGEHKRLALALQRFRRLKAARNLPDDAARILDQAHPGWTARADHATELWHSRAEEFIAWVQQHGRFPRPSAEDPAERFLSKWLHRQRHDARRERFPDRAKELDSRLPEWRETFSDQDKQSYVESAQQIAAYVQQTGSLPAGDGKNGSEAERLAGVLIVLRNQKRRGLLAKEATQTLDAAFPGWMDGIALSVDRHWQNRATEFIEWVKDNGRHP
ncbi:helicase associated domain-containing protein, partial [Paenarthrobacter nitroguajacolicus]